MQGMFERYTENARKATFLAREEASVAGSSCVEPEHLLLGIIRSCEPEVDKALRLATIEDHLRAQIAATARTGTASGIAFIPLSNQSKRSLAYAAEEAERLDSVGIGSGHLLLGVLRESESIGSRVLVAHDIDLLKARQIVGTSRSQGDIEESSRSRSVWASAPKRRAWIGIVGQLALIILLGAVVLRSTVTGRYLLLIATIWFVAALASNKLGPFSFFLGLGRLNRTTATAFAYVFGWLHQLFMFGWLFPLIIGIYRVIVRWSLEGN
jgi:hypothetical protein